MKRKRGDPVSLFATAKCRPNHRECSERVICDGGRISNTLNKSVFRVRVCISRSRNACLRSRKLAATLRVRQQHGSHVRRVPVSDAPHVHSASCALDMSRSLRPSTILGCGGRQVLALIIDASVVGRDKSLYAMEGGSSVLAYSFQSRGMEVLVGSCSCTGLAFLVSMSWETPVHYG